LNPENGELDYHAGTWKLKDKLKVRKEGLDAIREAAAKLLDLYIAAGYTIEVAPLFVPRFV
jgi:hypothetical protein